MVSGLLMELEDHNCWTIAEAAGHRGPHRLHHAGDGRLAAAGEHADFVRVDFSAAGLPTRPIFEPGRITLQQIRTCQPTFSAALVAFVETARIHDKERNALCPANPYPSAAEDWLRTTLIAQQAQAAWSAP
jgi:hypothetical protein